MVHQSESGQKMRTENPFKWLCPDCHGRLEATSPTRQQCEAEGVHFEQVDGIWRFLTPHREGRFNSFVREYEIVRHSEGRGSTDPRFYRDLPFQDRSGRHSESWRIRAVSFQTLIHKVLEPRETGESPGLKILDLGAGNCWLSCRLTQRGHEVAAVDLLTNAEDGLGAHIHYPQGFTLVQSDFDHLPLAGNQFDLAVFNAAFHYSADYEKTLREVCRVLDSRGQVIILDSPLYRQPGSGEQMVREREAGFRAEHGFPSNALDSENFLTTGRLEELTEKTDLRWQLHRPFYGFGWALKPWKAGLLGRREPATFALIVGSRDYA